MTNETEILQQADALLHQVIDPEIGINIVDLGLVYQLALSEDNEIRITMTLTTPGCPMSQTITNTITNLFSSQMPDYRAKVDLVWIPMWDPDMITDEGREQMNSGIFEKKPDKKEQSIWDRFF
jgi:metal-sulfur cluster biosynthetic enzyme